MRVDSEAVSRGKRTQVCTQTEHHLPGVYIFKLQYGINLSDINMLVFSDLFLHALQTHNTYIKRSANL